jgi:VanZ family protein
MKTVLLWLAIVFIVSVYPERTAPLIYGADKAFHFIVYAITCALFFTELKKHLKASLPALLVASAVLASAYGLVLEFAQVLIKARTFSPYDALANFLGAVTAAVAIAFIRRKR